jgi:cytochrome c-type biogenesis protein CcmF
MTAELGAFALVLAFCLSLAQTLLSFAGRARRNPVLAGGGEGAALGAFIALILGFCVLVHAFMVSDFSVLNVAENSHTEKPLLYKIAGAWGSHEGSILLWCLMLSGYGAALAVHRGLPWGLKALTLGVQGALGALFCGYMVFASNPLTRLARPPVEGRSLNPLLQDPALAAHPPFLYAGYVGLSVVFSLAVAALIEGKVDSAWARWIRPWTLAAWSLLTIGITLGSFWAYYELGWGGWWFWDPVENASLMPWLMATALLHSAIVTEKRGALASWTAFLAIAAFSLSMLGAFLVRSGILTSVHAFAVDARRGVALLAILGLAAGAAFALFAWRAPLLKDRSVFAPVSRESALVINNIVLVAVAGAVLAGTLWPLILEAAGRQGGVGAPYYNLVTAPLMAAAFILLPAGPLLAWKRADAAGAAQRLAAAALLALLFALAVGVLVKPRQGLAAVETALGAWLVLGALEEARGRIRLFQAPVNESARRLVGLPRGAWGMTLAHLGLGVFVMGAAFESAWRVENAAVMSLGQRLALARYSLVLSDVRDESGSNFVAQKAFLTITDGQGRVICVAQPERRTYDAGGETTSKVALCPRGLDDIYIVLGERRATLNGGSAWLIRSYWNRWAHLIFLGPLIMAAGGALSLSDRRTRLARGAARTARAARWAPAR